MSSTAAPSRPVDLRRGADSRPAGSAHGVDALAAWLGGRAVAGRVLGLVTGLGLAAAVLRALASDGSRSDLRLFHAVNAWAPAVPTLWSMLSVTGLGLTAFVLMALWLRPQAGVPARLMAALLYCYLFGGLVTQGLKHLWRAARPAAALGVEQIQVIGTPLLNNAMPSGHAVTACTLATLLGLSGRLAPSARLGLWLLALGVMASRVATGAHWPADVCAGAALGVVTAHVCWTLAGRSALARWLATAAGRGGQTLGLVVASAVLWRLQTGYPLAEPLQHGVAACGAWVGCWRLLRGGLAGGSARSLPQASAEVVWRNLRRGARQATRAALVLPEGSR